MTSGTICLAKYATITLSIPPEKTIPIRLKSLTRFSTDWIRASL